MATLPSDLTKVNFDAATDDPELARSEFADNVDKVNQLLAGLGPFWDASAGDGLTVSASVASIDLATTPGLEFAAGKIQVKVTSAVSAILLSSNGLEVDILGTTTDASPDLDNDWLLTEDVSTGLLKKIHPSDVASSPGPGSITQTEIASSAVGQAELKTTTGDMTSTAIHTLVTGPGGEYGFWPTIKSSTTTLNRFVVGVYSASAADFTDPGTSVLPTSFIQQFTLGEAGTQTITARQRYVQASPPYDLGDGEVAGFIFALMDNATGKPIAMYQAPEPPWALNGPTSIRPDRIINGKKFINKIQEVNGKKLDQPGAFKNQLIEITNEIKNADMDLIPHPFIGNDMTGKSVVLIDPMSKIVENMELMKNSGDSALDLFHDDFARIDNIELNRGKPNGVSVFTAKLTNKLKV